MKHWRPPFSYSVRMLSGAWLRLATWRFPRSGFFGRLMLLQLGVRELRLRSGTRPQEEAPLVLRVVGDPSLDLGDLVARRRVVPRHLQIEAALLVAAPQNAWQLPYWMVAATPSIFLALLGLTGASMPLPPPFDTVEREWTRPPAPRRDRSPGGSRERRDRGRRRSRGCRRQRTHGTRPRRSTGRRAWCRRSPTGRRRCRTPAGLGKFAPWNVSYSKRAPSR